MIATCKGVEDELCWWQAHVKEHVTAMLVVVAAGGQVHLASSNRNTSFVHILLLRLEYSHQHCLL